MAETINRRCPRCGRQAHDNILVLCPDCRVPFAYEAPVAAAATGELTPEQVQMLTRRILGSWKFWAALVILIGVGAGAVVFVADKVIQARSQSYLDTLADRATNRIGAVAGQISNQIAQEFRQPRIKATIEQVAMSRAGDIFSNGVAPSLDAFQDAMNAANAQLARSSNAVAQMLSDAQAAQQKVSAATAAAAAVSATPTPTPAPAPVAVTPALAKSAPAPQQPASQTGVKLTLINRSVVQAGNNYIVTLFFKNVGTVSSGSVDMLAGTYKQTARIVNFAAMTSATTQPAAINDTGDVARLTFPVSDREQPTVVAEVSGPTIMRFDSDALDADVTVPVAADRMLLPQASK